MVESVHKRGRTAIAAGGVAFAIILIFMELGLLGGVGALPPCFSTS